MGIAYYFGEMIRRFVPTRYLAKAGAILDEAQNKKRYTNYRHKYDIHPSFSFDGPDTVLFRDGDIYLGKNSYIGGHGRLKSAEGAEIRVGENTAISHFVFMYTINRMADQDLGEQKVETKASIAVGDNCWIGAFVFITRGVSIGDGTAVGTHSVVTKSLPPHSICAGSPAKVIKFKSYISKSQREALADEYWSVVSPELRHKMGRDQ